MVPWSTKKLTTGIWAARNARNCQELQICGTDNELNMDLPVAPTSNMEPQKMGSENDEEFLIGTVIWWVSW
jgi:hypothetical protein